MQIHINQFSDTKRRLIDGVDPRNLLTLGEKGSATVKADRTGKEGVYVPPPATEASIYGQFLNKGIAKTN